MATVAVRFIIGGGQNGPIDSAKALAEENMTSSGTSSASTITASGVAEEVCVIYPREDVRVAFGSSPTATTSAGPIAFANQPNAFGGLTNGDKVAIITAT